MGTASARTFGNLLRHYRLRAGLTQAALGERAGVSAVTVGQLERGVWKSPRTDTANLLADVLALDEPERRELFIAAGQQRVRRGPRPADAPLAAGPGQPLVGREADLAAVTAMLDNPAVRAITLVGPGGIGKTRLATEIARDAARAGRRVIAVSLLDEPGPVALLPAIARAAGMQAGADVHPALVRALGRQDVLVLLDNAEDRLLPGEPLGALLEALPRLALLATSREPLGLPFEHRYPLAPLAVPDPDAAGAAVRASPAATLFIERAALANARLARSVETADTADAELAAVGAIVRALDGMPLAIELAAAYAETMSPRALAALLAAEGIGAVTAGRSGVGRGEGIDAVVRWSVDRIAPDAAAALRASSVFAGGFTPAAFAEVAGAVLPDGSRPPSALLPDLLRSWLVREVEPAPAGEQVRFRLPEPVRQHALAELRASGEEPRARTAHLAWALGAIPVLAAPFEGPDPAPALPGLLAEMPNALAAIDAALADGDGAAAASLALALIRAWDFLGMQMEARRRLQRIRAVDGLPREVAADLLWWSAHLADVLGMAEDLRHDIGRFRALARPGDPVAEARALVLESGLSPAPGSAGSARDLLRRARELVRDEPPSFVTWAVLARLATETAALGLHAEALEAAHDARADAAHRGNGLDLAFADVLLGAALVETGRWHDAREALRTALRTGRSLRYVMVMLLAELNLARVAAASGDPAELAHAARLLGAADRLLVRHGYDYGHIWERVLADVRATIAATLGAGELEALVAEGRARSEVEGVALALGEEAGLSPAGARGRR